MGKVRHTMTAGVLGFAFLIPAGASAQPAAVGAAGSGAGEPQTQAAAGREAVSANNGPAAPLELHFEPGSAAITADVNSQLYALASWLSDDPSRTVVVAPSAAPAGSPLAGQRVEIVQGYLRDRGVDANRVAAATNAGANSSRTGRLVQVTERAPSAASDASSASVGSTLTSEPLLGSAEAPAPRSAITTAAAPAVAESALATTASRGAAIPAAEGAAPTPLPAPDSQAAPPAPPPNWTATPGAGRTLTKGKPRRIAARTASPLPTGAGHAYEYGRSAENVPDSDATAWRDASAHRLSGKGVGMTVGGGVVGFMDSNTADVANVGGSWEARVVYGTRSLVAVEVAYVGSAQSLALSSMPDNTLLMGHGAEGNMRFNLTQGLVQPYIFGGGGWTRYSLTRSDGGEGRIGDSDNVFLVPTGVGLSIRNNGMLFDLRGTARFVFNETMMRGAFSDRAGDGDLSSWNVSAKLGWEF